jgi:hypothetical protein
MKTSASIMLGALGLLALTSCLVDAFRSPSVSSTPVEHTRSTLTISGQSFGSNPQVCWMT